MRPKAASDYENYLCRGQGVHFVYVSPSGEHFTKKRAAMSCLGSRQANPASSSAFADGEDVLPAGAAGELTRAMDLVAATREAAAAWARRQHGESSGSDSEGDEDGIERCIIWGCKHKLLQCFGVKTNVADVVGCAQEAHVLCATCLERWWNAQNELRSAKGLGPVVRKVCPCCKTELRVTSEMRGDPDRYHMGLLKIINSWS